ncbi:MAG TPA: hypothetical protein EYN79_07415 [Planctomycetes bacterium]|nr:hypothetical protein [Planctomycetota bacterium]HIN80248.1 hypothetical protein [Planctomycetota bacterium]
MRSFQQYFWVVLALCLIPGALYGQADYVLSMTGFDAAQGGSGDVRILFDNTGNSGIQGWSFGCCNNSNELALQTVGPGSTTETINDGDEPGFLALNFEPGGWTMGCVIDLFGQIFLAPGTGYELAVANYQAIGAPETTTTVNFCNDQGTPAVSTVIVVAGQSIPPETSGAEINILLAPPPFIYRAPNSNAGYDPLDGIALFSVNLSIEEDPVSPGFPNATQGFSVSVTCDPGLVTPMDIVPTGAVAALNPYFVGTVIHVDGWSAGVIYSLQIPVFLAFVGETPAMAISGTSAAGVLTGNDVGATSALTFEANGSPPIYNVVTVNSTSQAVITFDGSLTFSPQTVIDYIRGDQQGDGITNIADGIWTLQALFNGGPISSCFDASDANADGLYDTADAITIFTYIFLGGAAPPAPFPGCGNTGEPQDCSEYLACNNP